MRGDFEELFIVHFFSSLYCVKFPYEDIHYSDICYFFFLCFLLKFFFNWGIVSAAGWYTYIASLPHLVFLLICQDNRGRVLHNSMCYLCTDISFIDKKNQVLCINFLLSFTTKCREFHVMHMLYWRRQRHPTPVLLPGKSHGWRGLVGCSPWGR